MPDISKILSFVKKQKYLFIILAAGVFLLMLPSGNDKKSEVNDEPTLEFSVEECENKIARILEKTAGVGKVEVALSVCGTTESVYASEENRSVSEGKDDYRQESDIRPSIVSSGSGRDLPLVVKQLYPEFLGAAVVCEGADSARVCLSVTQTVSSLTGISSERITITKMKN